MTLSTINPGDPGLQLTGECFSLRGALISLRDLLFQGFGFSRHGLLYGGFVGC